MALMHNLKLFRSLISLVCIGLFAPFFVFAVDYSLPPVDVSVSAIVDEDIIITSGGGGGGGFPTGVVFSGYAYPGASVHIWKNGVPREAKFADKSGYFYIVLQEQYSPNILYTLYAIDKEVRRSLLLNYPIVVKNGYVTQVSGIRFAPTISLDKVEVKKGDIVTLSGYALPFMDVYINIEGVQSKKLITKSNPDGTYKLDIPTSDFIKGRYNISVSYKDDKRISKVIEFNVGESNILSTELVTNIPGDCNADQVINLIDFSVAAFWYGKKNPPACVDTNKDNIINLVDFSILAFYWTG
jgi:hypothetical protein